MNSQLCFVFMGCSVLCGYVAMGSCCHGNQANELKADAQEVV
jgi:hypothetical protein